MINIYFVPLLFCAFGLLIATIAAIIIVYQSMTKGKERPRKAPKEEARYTDFESINPAKSEVSKNFKKRQSEQVKKKWRYPVFIDSETWKRATPEQRKRF